MKKTILILVSFLLSNTITNAQILEENSLYKVVYSETYQQPISLSYTLPYYKKLKTISLYGTVEYPEPYSNFIEPVNIITSDKNDYEGNIYDHGHLAPNATFPSESTKKYLWSYLNCALMHETLNSGVWRVLEDSRLKRKSFMQHLHISMATQKIPYKTSPLSLTQSRYMLSLN